MNLPKAQSSKNDKLKLAELESIRELLSKYDVQGMHGFSSRFSLARNKKNNKKGGVVVFFFTRVERMS